MKHTIGNYDIIDKIGAGAMSRVYLASPQSLPEKRVAIKILDPALAMDAEFVARFKREAHAVSFLQHGNVANIFDFGVEDGVHYIVMEYLQGADLRKVMDDASEIRETPGLPVGLVIYLIEEMAHGLRSAHERGILHRDIKPTNVLLGLEGEVKVVDFGLARSLDESSALPVTEATMSGAFLGTAAYASPEQSAKEKDLDVRSDVFSLGVLTYEMLTTRKPFMGNDLDSTLRMIIEDPHAPLSQSPCIPVFPELVALVDGMMAKQRDQRLPDMAAVLDALQVCRQGLEGLGIRYSNRRDHLARLSRDPMGYCTKLHAEAAAIIGDPGAEAVGEQTIVPTMPPVASGEGTIVPPPRPGTDTGRGKEPAVADPTPVRAAEAPAAPPEIPAAAEPVAGTAAAEPMQPPRPPGRRLWPWLAGVGLLAVVGAVAAIVLGVGPFASDTLVDSGWLRATASVDGAKLHYVEDHGATGGYPLEGPGVESVAVGSRATVIEMAAGNWIGAAKRDGYADHGQNWTVAADETVVVRFDLLEQGVEPTSLYVYAADERFDGARVYIDDILRQQRMPNLFENLAPGSHVLRVEIEVDGVLFEKEMEVELLPGIVDRRLVRFDD